MELKKDRFTQLDLSGYKETSREAYENLTNLSNKQQEVLDCLSEFGNMTNMEVSIKIGWSINRVTPRMNELVNKLKLVCEIERRSCLITGRKSIVWGLK